MIQLYSKIRQRLGGAKEQPPICHLSVETRYTLDFRGKPLMWLPPRRQYHVNLCEWPDLVSLLDSATRVHSNDSPPQGYTRCTVCSEIRREFLAAKGV